MGAHTHVQLTLLLTLPMPTAREALVGKSGSQMDTFFMNPYVFVCTTDFGRKKRREKGASRVTEHEILLK